MDMPWPGRRLKILCTSQTPMTGVQGPGIGRRRLLLRARTDYLQTRFEQASDIFSKSSKKSSKKPFGNPPDPNGF